MIQVQKGKNKILLSLTTELDYEDVQDLVLDLQNWLLENKELPKFTGISEEKVKEAVDWTNSKEYKEAKWQNDSKNKLAEDMRRCFVDVLDSEYIQKELTTYQLDPITKEVEIKTKKLKENGRNK